MGFAIKTCREYRKMNQATLAKEIGLSRSYLCLIELNKREPNLQVLQKIAEALKISLPILIFLASEKEVELSERLFKKIKTFIGELINE